MEDMLASVGFCEVSVRLKHESSEFIKDWLPGSCAEEYVVSAEIRAVRPHADGKQPIMAPNRGCCR